MEPTFADPYAYQASPAPRPVVPLETPQSFETTSQSDSVVFSIQKDFVVLPDFSTDLTDLLRGFRYGDRIRITIDLLSE